MDILNYLSGHGDLQLCHLSGYIVTLILLSLLKTFFVYCLRIPFRAHGMIQITTVLTLSLRVTCFFKTINIHLHPHLSVVVHFQGKSHYDGKVTGCFFGFATKLGMEAH